MLMKEEETILTKRKGLSLLMMQMQKEHSCLPIK